jgi:hypothetical protein
MKIIDKEAEELKKNLNKLNFIKGVAIYNDPNATIRRAFFGFDNRKDALIWYCEQNDMPYRMLTGMTDRLGDLISESYCISDNSFNPFPIPQELTYDLLKCIDLNNSRNTRLYYQTITTIVNFFQIPNNLTVVTEAGKFLISESFPAPARFASEVKVNEFGLFEISQRWFEFSYDSIRLSTRLGLFDYEGNKADARSLSNVLSILASRLDCKSPLDFCKMINDLEVGSYRSLSDSNVWYKKKGVELEFDCERTDGLEFYKYFETRVDREDVVIECVRDKRGNSTPLHVLYNYLKILNNGRDYRNSIIEHYVQNSLNLF